MAKLHQALPSQETAEALLLELQTILRLRDWSVKLRIVRAEEFEYPKQGDVNYYRANRTAVIRLLDPIDWNSHCRWEQDHLETLFHELLHLQFSVIRLRDDSVKDEEFESGLCHTAEALARLYREATGGDEEPSTGSPSTEKEQ